MGFFVLVATALDEGGCKMRCCQSYDDENDDVLHGWMCFVDCGRSAQPNRAVVGLAACCALVCVASEQMSNLVDQG